jgi:hypothetical protein
MKITIETVPTEHMRYATAGDWWHDEDGNLQLRVAALGDWRFEALVALHELVEVLLCKDRGVSDHAVDRFDAAWETAHSPFYAEPGDDPAAPYHREHTIAGVVERLLAHEFGIDWQHYDGAIDAALDPP